MRLHAVLLATAALLVVACAPPRRVPDQAEAIQPARPAYVAADHGGRLTATVRLTGTAPPPRRLAIGGDDVCVAGWREADGAADPRFVVGDDGALPNVIVFASEGPHTGFGYRPDQSPTADLIVRQSRCVYEPHVFGVMQRQTFVVANDDPTVHNVRTTARVNAGANFSQREGARDPVWFDEPEHAIGFECNVHTWMSALAFVFDHPFFGVTDARGVARIAGLPSGEYVFTAWHETFGTRTFSVTIDADAAAEVAVTLAAD